MDDDQGIREGFIMKSEGENMKKWNRLILFFLFVVLIAAMFGCKKDDGSKNEGKENHTSQKDGISTGEHTYPFTGIATDEDVDHRPFAVMINNQNEARPHDGIVDADIVFELLAEGDITRFLALFHSNIPEKVGSVRSAREYYFELAQGYDALYVYHGAANFVNDMINERNIEHLNGAVYDNDQQLFTRDTARKAPHNSYVFLDHAHEVAEGKGYDMTSSAKPLTFTEEAEIEGEDAKKIEVGYNGQNPAHLVSFSYDEGTGRYARSEDGEATTDLTTEAPIEIENILIIETAHHVFDSEGRREIDLSSGGSGYLVQQGVMQEITWENQEGQLIPTKDGQVVPFVQGKTWVNVVPTDPGLQSSVNVVHDE